MMACEHRQNGDTSPLDRLRHLEQQVNDRFGTSPAPESLGDLLPERGARFPLHWLPCARSDVSCFSNDPDTRILDSLADGDNVLIPIHPLSIDRLSGAGLIESGQISFSASYRTAFYEPAVNGPMNELSGDGRIMMLKLHLAEPLPGIPGDRRLTADILERCVWTTRVLVAEMADEPMARGLSVIPESFGIGSEDAGFLLRMMPDEPLVPVFSLYSRDPTNPAADPLIVAALKSAYGDDARRAAREAGSWLARPLIAPVLAGFRRGFSLEMHAQNTLVTMGGNHPIEHVYFRDMEGVLLFNDLRESLGLQPLNVDGGSDHVPSPTQTAERLFNRNIDHDLKRIFDGVLHAVESSEYFTTREVATATAAIARASNALIEEAGLSHLGRAGRIWPYSRAPWGNGLRPGHYFRTRYR